MKPKPTDEVLSPQKEEKAGMLPFYFHRRGWVSMGIWMAFGLGASTPWAAVFHGTLQDIVHCDIHGVEEHFQEFHMDDGRYARLECTTPESRILHGRAGDRTDFEADGLGVLVEGTLDGDRLRRRGKYFPASLRTTWNRLGRFITKPWSGDELFG